MRLATAISVLAGGEGSGCHGPNCGRPSKGSGKESRESKGSVKLSSKQLYKRALSVVRSTGVKYFKARDYEKWAECLGKSASWEFAGCGKLAEVYGKLGLSFNHARLLYQHMESWTESADKKLRSAAQEVVAGNPKSDLAKALTVENAIVRATYGNKEVTLYRGIGDEYAVGAIRDALKSPGYRFQFKVNGADSWTDSKHEAGNFGSIVVEAKVSTKYIMATYKTNPSLRDMAERELVVAWPGEKLLLDRRNLHIDLDFGSASDDDDKEEESDEDAAEVDLTEDVHWLHKNNKKNKKEEAKNRLAFGGQGSGCHGPNCGRHAENMRKLGYKPQGEVEKEGTKAQLYRHPISTRQVVVHDSGAWATKHGNVVDNGTKMSRFYSRYHPARDEQAVIKLQAEQESSGGAYSHAHIDPKVWFHPPSLTKRGLADHVPTDDPGETDDKYLDVTKRNSVETDEERMKLLKRSTPGGSPPQIPVRTSLVPMHQGVGNPLQAEGDEKARTLIRQRPSKIYKQARQFTAYGRRGCI